jgi:hypothetical protein
MFPNKEAQASLAKLHQRDSNGTLKEREHLYKAPLSQTTQEQKDKFLQSGGAGLFAKPKEYVKILGAILNDGVDPRGGKRILTKESVDLMWENQIPDQYVPIQGLLDDTKLMLITDLTSLVPVSHQQIPFLSTNHQRCTPSLVILRKAGVLVAS